MEKREDVLRVNINQIYPSLENPRKKLPRDLVTNLYTGAQRRTFLEELRLRAVEQPGLAEFLRGLDDLASSIKQLGQLVPIRVYPDQGDIYVIEMGERRWLSHLILFFERGVADSEYMDAILVSARGVSEEQKTLQRRMAENVHRTNLSPIEMAKGLCARLEEMRCGATTVSRRDLEERVGAENGITGRRVRQFVSLLTLCDEALELAEQGGLTERALRGVLKYKEPAKQVAAVQRLIRGPEKETNTSKSPGAPNVWAKTFVRDVLGLKHRGKELKAYERALRVHLKKNPRARTLLGRILDVNWNGSGKRAVSQVVCTGDRKNREATSGSREKQSQETRSTRDRGRSHRGARRRGRT